MALSTPNSRPPSAIGTCMNELTPCVSTTQRTKRSLSSGVETYGSPVAAARPIMPSPSLKRARIRRAQTPRPATPRSSPPPGS